MDLVRELQQNRLFKGLSEADLKALIGVMERQYFEPGDVLFRKGDAGARMYVVLAGRVRIYMEDSAGNPITFRFYGPREIFGEFAVLDQQPRSTFADAEQKLEVLSLDRESFLAVLQVRPLVGLAMMRSLAERVRYTTIYLEKVLQWTHLLSAGEYDNALRELMVSAPEDDDMQMLITSFIDLFRNIQQREASLRARSNDNSAQENA